MLTDGLTTVGRDISRYELLEAVRKMRGLETGVMPPIKFGPNLRVAARGALIIINSAETGKTSSRWISLAE